MIGLLSRRSIDGAATNRRLRRDRAVLLRDLGAGLRPEPRSLQIDHRRSHPSLRRQNDLLADLALGLRAEIAAQRPDQGRLSSMPPTASARPSMAARISTRRCISRKAIGPAPIFRSIASSGPAFVIECQRQGGGRSGLHAEAGRHRRMGGGAWANTGGRDRAAAHRLEHALERPQGLSRRRYARRRQRICISPAWRAGGGAARRGASRQADRHRHGERRPWSVAGFSSCIASSRRRCRRARESRPISTNCRRRARSSSRCR